MTWPLIVAGACAIVTAIAGALLTRLTPWYRALRKPSFQPPDWLFGPAWTVIFALAAYSGARAWTDAPDARTRLLIVLAFGANMVLNAGWSLLFFTLRRPNWALAEVGPLWLSIAAMIAVVAPVSSLAAWALAPYLAWVSFAAVLNRAIVRLNPVSSPGLPH